MGSSLLQLYIWKDLSWDYLQYVRNNKIRWEAPTEILYGSLDNLQSIDTMNEFAKGTASVVTVMEGSEHWFRTDKQMKFLEDWMKERSNWSGRPNEK